MQHGLIPVEWGDVIKEAVSNPTTTSNNQEDCSELQSERQSWEQQKNPDEEDVVKANGTNVDDRENAKQPSLLVDKIPSVQYDAVSSSSVQHESIPTTTQSEQPCQPEIESTSSVQPSTSSDMNINVDPCSNGGMVSSGGSMLELLEGSTAPDLSSFCTPANLLTNDMPHNDFDVTHAEALEAAELLENTTIEMLAPLPDPGNQHIDALTKYAVLAEQTAEQAVQGKVHSNISADAAECLPSAAPYATEHTEEKVVSSSVVQEVAPVSQLQADLNTSTGRECSSVSDSVKEKSLAKSKPGKYSYFMVTFLGVLPSL